MGTHDWTKHWFMSISLVVILSLFSHSHFLEYYCFVLPWIPVVYLSNVKHVFHLMESAWSRISYLLVTNVSQHCTSIAFRYNTIEDEKIVAGLDFTFLFLNHVPWNPIRRPYTLRMDLWRSSILRLIEPSGETPTRIPSRCVPKESRETVLMQTHEGV